MSYEKNLAACGGFLKDGPSLTAPLAPVEYFEPGAMVRKGNCAEVLANSWQHPVSVDLMQCLAWEDLPAVPVGAIGVLLEVVHLGHTEVVSDCDVVPFDKFAEGLPGKALAETSVAQSSDSSKAESQQKVLLAQFPFLEHHFA